MKILQVIRRLRPSQRKPYKLAPCKKSRITVYINRPRHRLVLVVFYAVQDEAVFAGFREVTRRKKHEMSDFLSHRSD